MFSVVSVCDWRGVGKGSQVTITHDVIGQLTIHELLTDKFKFVYLGPYCTATPPMFIMTVGKRAICIHLICLLVTLYVE